MTSSHSMWCLSTLETGESAADAETMDMDAFVKARWSAVDGIHVGTVSVPDAVRAGDCFDIWVDANGNYAEAPTPPSPGRDGGGRMGSAVMDRAGSRGGRWGACSSPRLDRARYADWDRDLKSLAGNDGGRANHEH